MTLSSASFKNGRAMPKKFGASVRDCGGQNISPALAWSNVPANTKSFALTMFDPDGRKGLGVVHWVAYDIAAATISFKEGAASTESPLFVGGTNLPGTKLYFGPCPPPGDAPHPYVITVIALDLAPGALQAGLTLDAFNAAIKDHALGAASTVGLYSR
jgi:Raf kinase inhibitor-like YbhB/YbcL family protein